MASRHAIWVAAKPATVYHAARTADLGRPWLVRILLGLRSIPAWFGRSSAPERGRSRRSVGAVPFTLIDEIAGEEFVLGVMGRFWVPTGGLVSARAEQFRQSPPPGLAQGVWNFRVEASGTGTMLSTETRVRCADPVTRRQFMRYWRVIRLGSGLIRRSMLRYIRAIAEQRAG